MRRSVAAFLLTLSAAWAQSAGTRALVTGDELPVYRSMVVQPPPAFLLHKGDVVVIGLVLFGDEVTWCSITRPGETRRLGFVSCEGLGPERAAASPPEPAAASPPAPAPLKAPVRVREVAPAPIRAQEIERTPIPAPGGAPAPQSTPAAPPPSAGTAPAQTTPTPSPVPATPAPTAITKPAAPPAGTAPVPTPVAAAPASPATPPPRPGVTVPATSAPAPPPAATAVAVPTHATPAPVPVPKRTTQAVAANLPPAVKEAPPAHPPVPKPEPRVAPPSREPDLSLPPDVADWVLGRSGHKAAISAYVRTTSLMSFLDKSRLQEIETGLLAHILSKHFEPNAFVRGAGGQFRSAETPERNRELVRWLRDPETQSLTARLEAASRPDARHELVAFATRLRQSPPSDSRLALIHRLWEATRSSDIEVDTTLSLVRSLAGALNPILPKEKQFSRTDLDQAMTGVRSKYQPLMKNARVVFYLFAFERASDAELERYVRFWESSAGVWLAGTFERGFAASARSVARDLSAEIERRGKLPPAPDRD